MHRTEWSGAARANMADFSDQIRAYLGKDAQEFSASQGRLFNAPEVLDMTIPTGSSLWSNHDLAAFAPSCVEVKEILTIKD